MAAKREWRLSFSHPSFSNPLRGLAAPAERLGEIWGSTGTAMPESAFPVLESQPSFTSRVINFTHINCIRGFLFVNKSI